MSVSVSYRIFGRKCHPLSSQCFDARKFFFRKILFFLSFFQCKHYSISLLVMWPWCLFLWARQRHSRPTAWLNFGSSSSNKQMVSKPHLAISASIAEAFDVSGRTCRRAPASQRCDWSRNEAARWRPAARRNHAPTECFGFSEGRRCGPHAPASVTERR